MQTETKGIDTSLQDQEFNEEMAGILVAISVVSKRLAKKIMALEQQDRQKRKGGKPGGQDE